MPPRAHLFTSGLVLIGLAFGVPVTGCGSYEPADFCEDSCDCDGCSDLELEECIDDSEDLYDRAVAAGCEELADEYLSCLEDEGECRGDGFDIDGCEQELERASSCVEGGSGSGGGQPEPPPLSGAGGGGAESPAPSCDAPVPSPSGGACVTIGGDVECNPVTNEPCGDDRVCDAIGATGGFQCYSVVAMAPLCASCAESPCSPGTVCPHRFDWPGGEQCTKTCCDDSDCGTGVCVKDGIAVPGAPIGVCLVSAP